MEQAAFDLDADVVPGEINSEVAEGELEKQRGMAVVDAAEPEDWKRRTDAAIASLASSGEPFTSEDVRAIAGDPDHPNAMGPRFAMAVRAGLIEPAGRTPARRPSLHAHRIQVWRGTGERI